MRTENAPSRDDIVKLIATMSKAQLALLYRVAQDIRDYPAAMPDDEPTEEEVAAEDAQWDASLARHADKFDALAAEACADIEAGKVLPMFDDKGRWLVDDYTDEDFESAAKSANAA